MHISDCSAATSDLIEPMSSNLAVKKELLERMDSQEGGTFGVAELANGLAASKVAGPTLPPVESQQTMATEATRAGDTFMESQEASCFADVGLTCAFDG